jgi:hypothetical protein
LQSSIERARERLAGLGEEGKMTISTADNGIGVFAARDISPQVLGRVLLITAVSPGNQGVLDGESYVFVERGQRTYIRTSIRAKTTVLSSVGLRIDSDFVAHAALDVSKAVIGELLNDIFKQTNNLSIYTLPFVYDRVDVAHVARLWMLKCWQKELMRAEAEVVAPELKSLLSEIVRLPSLI